MAKITAHFQGGGDLAGKTKEVEEDRDIFETWE
jgi:hypothetical protein